MEHEGLKNLYEQVITGNFQWERWGLLGVLCDYVLNYNNGNILEIGCGESSIFPVSYTHLTLPTSDLV